MVFYDVEFQIGDHPQVVLGPPPAGSKVVTDHCGIRTGKKDKRLKVAQIDLSAARDLNIGIRKEEPIYGNYPENFERRDRRCVFESRPLDRI
jgi:hypothetical protein